MQTERAGWLAVLALLAGNAALSLGALFVRLADTGPVSAAFWRLFLALPLMMVLAWIFERRANKIESRSLVWVALASGAFAVDLGIWHIGIEMTRLGNATLFGNAASLVLMFWGFLIARCLPDRYSWLTIALALAGGGLLMGRSLMISTETLLGDVLSLAAGLIYAVYLLLLKSARTGIGTWSMLSLVSIFACPVLYVFATALDEAFWPSDWAPLIGLSLVSQLMGQGLLIYAMRHFSSLVIGLALLTQPAVASLSGVGFFGEMLGPFDILGIVLVGCAMALATARPTQLATETHPITTEKT
ncbi:MAG: DMT family transporter [Novosphingobium sp.]|nr:DMT family transporter [Novosphingobium sp.]